MTNDDEWVTLRLTPVEVFGSECEHHVGDPIPVPLGLMDATEAGSDCNRAWGRIYRIEDLPASEDDNPTERVEVRVRRVDLPWFDIRRGEEYPDTQNEQESTIDLLARLQESVDQARRKMI